MTPEENKFRLRTRKKLEELFPKGKCKERGAAIVFYAEVIMAFQEIMDQKKLL